jgi:hypothetical protein
MARFYTIQRGLPRFSSTTRLASGGGQTEKILVTFFLPFLAVNTT